MNTQGRLLDWLAHCAAEGQLCPTNDAICERFGYASTSMASRLIASLEKRRAITLERLGRVRVVTITATGATTARPEQSKPNWRRNPERPQQCAMGRFVGAPPPPPPALAAERALTPLAFGESPSPQLGEGEPEPELVLTSVGDAIAHVKRHWPEMWARTRAIAAEQRMLPGEALFRAIEAGLERIDA